ncbi:MAG: hypothetical protein II048_07470, partial [Bacteroidales bacterium]|nr:hypothetical protein [Bacteroidales bacterium]
MNFLPQKYRFVLFRPSRIPERAGKIPKLGFRRKRECRFYAIFVMAMKRMLVISYWVLSIFLVAVILTSLGYR